MRIVLVGLVVLLVGCGRTLTEPLPCIVTHVDTVRVEGTAAVTTVTSCRRAR